uniref:G_PROTEIN_RECEP_F1_2 domain-containing protein n=1 Tax=Syphacia muris TaxID=451379 RepID=A0A158R491_9BILA
MTLNNSYTSSVCLNETQLKMHGTEAEKYIQRYVYSVIFLVGVTGNVLNLTVLLRRNVKTRSNSFLAALAFADIVFLIILLPNILANYPFLGSNYVFRYLYFHSKVHLLSLNNWASGVAIWCVIAVSADRLLVYPLYIRNEWDWYVLPGIVGGIVVLTRLFSLYQHFEYSCKVRTFCFGSQLISMCFPVTSERFGNKPNPYSKRLRAFIAASKMTHAVVMIIIPIITLIILNTLLLLALRRRKQSILNTDLQRTKSVRDNQTHYIKTEHRVTVTVALIVTAFTITNGPSALMQFIKWSDPRYPTLVCNTLVILGKAINFILFCLSSKHFRRRLMQLVRNDVSKQFNKFSNLSVMITDTNTSNRLSRFGRQRHFSSCDILRK